MRSEWTHILDLAVVVLVEIQRPQHAITVWNAIHFPEQIARFGGEALRGARPDRRAMQRLATQRFVQRLAGDRVLAQFFDVRKMRHWCRPRWLLGTVRRSGFAR